MAHKDNREIISNKASVLQKSFARAVPMSAGAKSPTVSESTNELQKLRRGFWILVVVVALQGILLAALSIRFWLASPGAGPPTNLSSAEENPGRMLVPATIELPPYVRDEIDLLSARNKLTMLADQAISTGSRFAYRELDRYFETPELPALKDACNAEIIRVESHFIATRRYRSFEIPVAKLYIGRNFESEVTTEELILLLSSTLQSWEHRARAAQLLGESTEDDPRIPAALVKALRSDPDLYVVQEALRSFGKLTGFRSLGVFDTKGAVERWKEIEERLEKPEAAATP